MTRDETAATKAGSEVTKVDEEQYVNVFPLLKWFKTSL
jgi:hypothetical protein